MPAFPSAALTPGTRLGPYEIVALIGRGGMGEVYRARDTQLDRHVALKLVSEAFASDPERLARFHREAKVLASLNHPNITQIYGFEQSGASACIVMELLEGETLRSRIALGPLPARDVAAVALDVAEALATAHAQGITHRDLKPENIFLTSSGRVKILDFGLARRESHEAVGNETAAFTGTEAGTVMGTIGYMSPEQVRGEKAEATSDIFSLGCVIYEAVTARRAFERPSPAETLVAILNEEPMAMDGLPPELSRVLRHCLEKHPHERFQSARDLAFDLRSLAAFRKADEEAADSLAVLPFTNAGGPDAEYLSDGIAESLINSFSQISRLRVIPRSVVFRYKGHEVDPRVVARELGVRMLLSGKVVTRDGRLIVQAELVDAVANKQLWGERLHRPLTDLFEVEEEITRQITDKLRIRLSGKEKQQLARRSTDNREAYQLYLNARYHFLKRTPASLEKGIQYCEQAIEQDPEFALGYAALADCYIILGAMSVLPARQPLAKAREAANRAVDVDGTLAEAHSSLAFVRAFDWDWPQAEKGFRHAMELNPGSWATHDWYGQTLQAQGRLDEALVHIRRAQELEPLSVVLHHHAAWLLWLGRRHEATIEECRKAHELDPNFPQSYMWTGLAYEQMSRYEESLAALRTGTELWKRMPICLGSLAHACAASGRHDEARELLRELEERAQERYVEPYAMALIHAGLGETDRVFEWLGEASKDLSLWLTLLVKCDPRLDALRSDARFRDLLRGMRLD